MKTQNVLQIVSVSAFIALATSLYAGDTLLPPRAKDNQIKISNAIDNSPNTVAKNSNLVASPRTIDNRIKIVAGTRSGPDAMDCSRKMVASPKAVGECASHPGASMPCCAVATAK